MMSKPYLRISAALLSAVFHLFSANAQMRSAGTTYSYSGVSLIYEQSTAEDSFMELQLQAELGEVFMDRTDIPGISATFTWNYVIRTWTTEEGNDVRLFAGPGAVLGYGNDFRKEAGLFFGLKGKAGVDCRFKRGVRISICLAPILGYHMTRTGEYLKMEYYRNGLLNAVMPEIGICYMF